MRPSRGIGSIVALVLFPALLLCSVHVYAEQVGPVQAQDENTSAASGLAQERKESGPESNHQKNGASVQPSASKSTSSKWMERQKSARPEPPDTLSGTSTLAIFTLVVVVLILVFFFVLRRLSRSRLFASGGVMQIMSRKALSPKQVLYLVEVGPKVYLIGTTRENLVTLGVFSKKEDVAVLRSLCMSKTEQSMEKSFKSALHESLDEWSAETKKNDTVDTLFTELSEIKNKVKGWNA